MSCTLLHGLTTISWQICALSSTRDPPPQIRAIDVDRCQVNKEETTAVASISAPASRGADAGSNVRSLAGTSLLLDESPPPPPPLPPSTQQSPL
jgi:hypothetical protein